MRHWQVAQTVSHVILDHMSSSGVMHGDGRRRGEETVKHVRKKKNIAVVLVRYRNRELGDEIEGDCFKGKGVLWFDWVEGGFSPVCVRFVCLALSATLHIVDNKLLHVRPPVVMFEEGKSVQNSRVSGHRCVMVEVQHPFLNVMRSRHTYR